MDIKRAIHTSLGLVLLCTAASKDPITALSIPPSTYWSGNDGWWSTFEIQVGTPGQIVRLLPGTSTSAGTSLWVVLEQGCAVANPNLTDCAIERGYNSGTGNAGLEEFQSNQSSTWSVQGLANGGLYDLNTLEERSLGYSGNAYYGFDTVSWGGQGSALPTLDHQIIAGFATNDFWLGSLGISPKPINFTSLNDPQLSLLGSLKNRSLIPSSSWAYTAGAYYQNPPVLGSLTFGGYDTTRFQSNNVSFAMGADFSRDLLVSLRTISYDTLGSSPLLASSIDILIDSMVSQIWLPVDVCQAFEQEFNLTWNSTAEVYLVDDDVHKALLAQNPTFTFTVGASGNTTGETVDIVLPYAAFDLNISANLANPAARYFPLKQAQNSSQYTLGRAFLQEAYVVADFERHNFSVSQASFPATSVPQRVVSIEAPGSDPSSSSSSRLSKGAIAGIVVGAAVILAVILGLSIWRLKRKRQQERRYSKAPLHEVKDGNSTPFAHRREFRNELDDGDTAVRELDADHAIKPPELDSRAASKPELASHDSHGNRHELEDPGKVHEMGGLPIAELEAPVRRSELGGR